MDPAAWAQLLAARRHAQDAADAARAAAALLSRTQSPHSMLGSLVLDLEEWANAQTAVLSRLIMALHGLETGPLQ